MRSMERVEYRRLGLIFGVWLLILCFVAMTAWWAGAEESRPVPPNADATGSSGASEPAVHETGIRRVAGRLDPSPQDRTKLTFAPFINAEPKRNPARFPLTDREARLSTAALAGWSGAQVVDARRSRTGLDGSFRRVGLVQPPDTPYRVRIEEWVRVAENGAEFVEERIEVVADHVLVALAEGVRAADIAGLWSDAEEPFTRTGVRRWPVDRDDLEAVPSVLSVFSEAGAKIRFAEPDYIVRSFDGPNDPRFLDGSLWGLNNTGQASGLAGAHISAVNAWNRRSDASAVIVGIIDSGIRLTHEDLVANLWVNPHEAADGTDTDGNGFVDDLHGINAIRLTGDPTDDQGHGTHVAGTVGAVGNNGVGVTGVAWNVQLMALKFLSSGGGGSTSDAIVCIEYGIENGADILNNSWGGIFFSQALFEAVEIARDAGVIFVAAAGNSATNNDSMPVYPASLPLDNVIAVASTDRQDGLSSFSSYGQGFVDIAAPGTDILSVGNDSDSHYRTLSGTSMAAPHVAGALALLRAEYPEDTWPQLINRLYRGSDRLTSLGEGFVGFGGRLNLENALNGSANRPFNDDFKNSRTISGDVALIRAFNYGATSEAGQPAINGDPNPRTVWFDFTPSADGQTSVAGLDSKAYFSPLQGNIKIPATPIPVVVAAYTGDSVETLSPEGEGEGSVTFTAVAGTTYRIAVAGVDGTEGMILLDVVGPPRNSNIANAIPLLLSRSVSGTNRNALPESGELDHAGQPAAHSVWFRWTATVAGRVGFSTRGSSFNTLAAVYSGPATGATVSDGLVPVASNINAVDATFSRVDFQAVAGVTYYIAVDGLNGASGNLSALIALPPANDNFDSGTVISGTSIQRTVSTFFATREPGEPRHMPGRGNGETVWLTWTAPESSRVTLSSGGSFHSAILAVYTGNAVDALNLVARDGAENRPARLTFDAIQGTTYRIAVEPWDWSLASTPFSLQSTPVPPNERFADAIRLDGVRTTMTGSNAGARREPGEPNQNYNSSGSVWYTWTAPTTGEYGIYGERLDKPRRWNVVLNVFTGTEVNALTHVKEDFGNGIGYDAFVRWHAVAGRTYHIQVTSLNEQNVFGGEGPFRLDLRPRVEHAPINDNFASAIELDGSTVYNFRTHGYALTAEPGEPNHSGLTASETLWWKFPVGPGQGGRYAVATGMSEGGWLTTIYRTTQPDAPAFRNLVPVANNYESASMAFPEVAWNAVEGETYYIVHERALGGRGRFIFHFHKVPDNYILAGRERLTGTSARVVTHNWGAIREPGEPSLGAGASRLGGRSLWWSWTAPESGRYQLDTIGSETPVNEDNFPYPDRTMMGFNTRLGVFTGSSLGGLSQVAQNFNRTIGSYGNSWFGEQQNSRLEFNATAGTTYIFLVNGENIDGINGTENPSQTNTGRIRLNLTKLEPPSNSFFAGATEITSMPYQRIQKNFAAVKESGEPNHGGVSGGRSLWWKWTATESERFIVSTAGNLYDDYHARRTGIGVYTGASVNSLTLVASNQNGAGMNTGENTWSSLSFQAVAGTTYYFAADSAFAGNLAFFFDRPAPNDHFANATEMVGSRWTTVGHHLETTVEPGEPRIDGGYMNEPTNNFRSVWYRWTAPVSGEITLDTMGSESVNLIGVFTGSAVDALTPITEIPRSGGNPFNGDAERRARAGNNRGITRFMATVGTTYHISVQGSGYIVVSSGPLVLTLEGPPAVPFAPANFVAVRSGPNRIDLLWEDVAVDEESYVIERRVGGGKWEPLHETGPDVVRYTDFTVAGGVTYSYRLKARNSVGSSAFIEAEVRSSLKQWRFETFGTAENLGDGANTAAPFGDGIANLLKYAFNLDPTGPDSRILVAGEGNAGLPVVILEGQDGVLVVEFIRRRVGFDSGIAYRVQFSALLDFSEADDGGAEEVSPVDGYWERVRVRDTNGTDGSARFGRVVIDALDL